MKEFNLVFESTSGDQFRITIKCEDGLAAWRIGDSLKIGAAFLYTEEV